VGWGWGWNPFLFVNFQQRSHRGAQWESGYLFPSSFTGTSRTSGNQITMWLRFLQCSSAKAFWAAGLGAGRNLCIETRNSGCAGVPSHRASAQTSSSWRDHTAAAERVTTQETQHSVAFVPAWFQSQLCSTAPSASPPRAGRLNPCAS